MGAIALATIWNKQTIVKTIFKDFGNNLEKDTRLVKNIFKDRGKVLLGLKLITAKLG